MSGVIVDIGTGDGRFVYELAKNHPDKFIIGIDPAHKPLTEISGKIYKKKSKGGLKNALFVLANVEDLPDELTEIANQIFINFPWSGLLEGIIKADAEIWKNIKKIAKPGAFVDIITGYNEEAEKNEITERKLPEFTANYIQTILKPSLKKQQVTLLKFKKLSPNDLKNYPTSWAKKLIFGQSRDFYYIKLLLPFLKPANLSHLKSK